VLVGWLAVRIIAALFANDAFMAWLRRRSGRR
jgi:hypothetical protein